MDVEVHDDAAGVAARAAELFVATIARHADAIIGLAGGSTPRATYERIGDLDGQTDSVLLWLGDERWVPAHHQDSNARLWRDSAPRSTAEIIVPDHSLRDPMVAAAKYGAELQGRIGTVGRGGPDMVLLGMGDDGHTASLFPGSSALDERERIYVATWVAALSSWRLTATLPLLATAHRVVFLVTGANKARRVAEIIDEGAPYPARLVAERAPATWLLDRAAAAELRSSPREG